MTDIYQVSNYTPCQIGLVKGERGENGTNGANGINGKDGKDGKDGLRGLSGSDGKSNYQLALDSGFIGSLDDYLASIRGADGADGEKGEKGDVLFATFDINILTGELEMVTPTEYSGASFALNGSNLEVTI